MAKSKHPEQDPAEGSRKVIEDELAAQGKNDASDGKDKPEGNTAPDARRDKRT